MKMTIKRKLTLSALFALVIMVGIGIYSVMLLRGMDDVTRDLTQNIVPGINDAHTPNTLTSDYRILEYRHIISASPQEMSDIEKAMESKRNEIDAAFSRYEETITIEEDKALFDRIQEEWHVYLEEHEKVIALSREMKTDEAMAMMTVSGVEFDKASSSLLELVKINLEFAQEAEEKADTTYSRSRTVMIGVIAGAVVLSILIQGAIIRGITQPLFLMQRSLNDLVERGGDLTQKIDIQTGDEIQGLSDSVNRFIGNLQGIISGVLNISGDISAMADQMNDTVAKLNYDIEEISATTEEMSAGLEETNATTEEINSISHEVENVSIDIARKAEESAANSEEISNRAQNVQEIAVQSSQHANDIYDKSNAKLLKAMEDAKAVGNINVLAESILGITTQTNLLALNAAIEAARAGEAGRGFAVVADEIRKLAEESKDSANRIQEVTKVIVDAVEFLSDSSREVLAFVDNRVKGDYQQFLNVSEQYKKDADFVTGMSSDMRESAEVLADSIQNIVSSIGDISKSAEESAVGATNIAVRSSDILERSKHVSEMASASKKNVQDLMNMVSKFKV